MALSNVDHDAIATAIRLAERRTTGEIYCVLAERVSDHRESTLIWAVAAAFVVPALLIPLGFGPAWWARFGDGWAAAQVTAAGDPALSLSAYAVLQIAVFGLVLLFSLIPGVRTAMVPLHLRRARVHKAAMAQFLAHGLHRTAGRTGVLIFASRADRLCEVVADEGIHARVPQSVWAEAVDSLGRGLAAGDPAAGFLAAIRTCGAVLAEHFPADGRDANELPDRLIEY